MLHNTWVATKAVGRVLRLALVCSIAVGFMVEFGRVMAGG